MFPVLNHINDLLPYIKDNPQFRVQEQPNGTTVVCYMLQDEDTFRGEHEEFYKECRGITFDTQTGEIVSRTLHKFQNVGENESTQPHLIPWDKITRVMDKRDGSMITPVLIDQGTDHAKIVCKTKKTFTSAEAIAATEFINKDPAMVNWVLKWLINGYTPTFEWTSPKFPIVLLYDKDELTLLQIRNNKTGEYMDLTKGPHYQKDDYELMPFPIVENLIDDFKTDNVVDYQKFYDLQLSKTGVEGWIIQTKDGQMWKLKTKWYCDLHHAVTFTRWRDIARNVLEDKSDDLKAAFAMTGRSIDSIVKVENTIKTDIHKMKVQVKQIAEEAILQNLSAKELFAQVKDNQLSLHIMRHFNGKPSNDESWVKHYQTNLLSTWSLDVVE